MNMTYRTKIINIVKIKKTNKMNVKLILFTKKRHVNIWDAIVRFVRYHLSS